MSDSIYAKLKQASGKLDLLLSEVRKLQWRYSMASAPDDFFNDPEVRQAVERISDMFSVSEMNQLNWIKDVYNRQV